MNEQQTERSGKGSSKKKKNCSPQVETFLTMRLWMCQSKWTSSLNKPRHMKTCASATSDGQYSVLRAGIQLKTL